MPSDPQVPGELAGHPDRLRWNARYAAGFTASFAAHPLAVRALAAGLPDGPVLELACGASGSALLAAAAGRRVTAVDVSDVALCLLGEQARRRGLGELITVVQADLTAWRPPRTGGAAHPQRSAGAGEGADDGGIAGDQGGYALVLCTGYWDRAVFAAAAGAVAPGGLLAWEAFTAAARRERPGLCAQWCLGPGEPAALLPPGFTVLSQQDVADRGGTRRFMLARRAGSGAVRAGASRRRCWHPLP
jgi:SAM-dependent methyltransferase